MVKYLIAVSYSEDGHIIPNTEYSVFNYNKHSKDYLVINSYGKYKWYSQELFKQCDTK